MTYFEFSSPNFSSLLPPPFQPQLDYYINRSAVVYIRYMDSRQGTWTHIPCQSVYSPSPSGSGEYKL